MILNLLPIGMTLLCITTAVEDKSKRILNGVTAFNGQFPYVGLLEALNTKGYYRERCTAILLDHATIITAAHCFCMYGLLYHQHPNYFSVKFGSVNKYDTLSRQTSLLKNIYVHESFASVYYKNCTVRDNYQYPLFVFDIAIAKLQSPMNYTRSVMPIELSSVAYRRGKHVTIVGFGLRLEDSDSQSLDLELHWGTTVICKEFGKFIFSCRNCLPPIESQPLKGDSGGPVLYSAFNPFLGVMAIIISSPNNGGEYIPSYLIHDWVYRNNQFKVLQEKHVWSKK